MRQFHRVSQLPPYVFEEVNRLKAQLRAAGADVIDFGMGNPDMPPPQHVVEKLIETARDPSAHGYSTSKGIPGLRRAIAAYYRRRFDVAVDPDARWWRDQGSRKFFATRPGGHRTRRRHTAPTPPTRVSLRLPHRAARSSLSGAVAEQYLSASSPTRPPCRAPPR